MAYDYGGGAYGGAGAGASLSPDDELDYHFGLTLEEWARDKPLSILQLDPADRAVLRIAGNDLLYIPIIFIYPTIDIQEPSHTIPWIFYSQCENLFFLYFILLRFLLIKKTIHRPTESYVFFRYSRIRVGESLRNSSRCVQQVDKEETGNSS